MAQAFSRCPFSLPPSTESPSFLEAFLLRRPCLFFLFFRGRTSSQIFLPRQDEDAEFVALTGFPPPSAKCLLTFGFFSSRMCCTRDFFFELTKGAPFIRSGSRHIGCVVLLSANLTSYISFSKDRYPSQSNPPPDCETPWRAFFSLLFTLFQSEGNFVSPTVTGPPLQLAKNFFRSTLCSVNERPQLASPLSGAIGFLTQ